jgi:hypothetical protein
MTTSEQEIRRLDGIRVSIQRTVYSVVFGDRTGSILFLGTLSVCMLFWTGTVSLNDNYTLANAMVSLADGQLAVESTEYNALDEFPRGTPGMRISDGKLYAGKYGHLFLALPFAWLFEGMAMVTELRVGFAALWSGVVLFTGIQLSRAFGNDRRILLASCGVALGAFLANVYLAAPFKQWWIHQVALQVVTTLATAFTAVFAYRLLKDLHDRKTGLSAGVMILTATPLLLWARVPKRHALIAGLAIIAVYAFYRSLTDERRTTLFRSTAYAVGGISVFVFPLESVVLLGVLGVADLVFHRPRSMRAIAIPGVALFLSLVPFFVTNYLITGNPLVPPVLLPGYIGGEIESGRQASSVLIQEEGSSDAGGPLALVILAFTRLLSFVLESLLIPVQEPERIYRTFFRGGYDVIADTGESRAISLTFFEAMPFTALFAVLPFAYLPTVRNADRIRKWIETPAGKVDLIVIGYTLGLVFVYLSRLPGHAQVTVRYLVPIMPFLVYLAFRVPEVRSVFHGAPWVFGWTYAIGVLIGGQLLIAVFGLTDYSFAEMFQIHALLGLSAAVLVAVWIAIARSGRFDDPKVGAVVFGIAATTNTIFVVSACLVYFTGSQQLILSISGLLGRTGLGIF